MGELSSSKKITISLAKGDLYTSRNDPYQKEGRLLCIQGNGSTIFKYYLDIGEEAKSTFGVEYYYSSSQLYTFLRSSAKSGVIICVERNL